MRAIPSVTYSPNTPKYSNMTLYEMAQSMSEKGDAQEGFPALINWLMNKFWSSYKYNNIPYSQEYAYNIAYFTVYNFINREICSSKPEVFRTKFLKEIVNMNLDSDFYNVLNSLKDATIELTSQIDVSDTNDNTKNSTTTNNLTNTVSSTDSTNKTNILTHNTTDVADSSSNSTANSSANTSNEFETTNTETLNTQNKTDGTSTTNYTSKNNQHIWATTNDTYGSNMSAGNNMQRIGDKEEIINEKKYIKDLKP